jgi:hypothetical protein
MYERGKVMTDAPWSIDTDFTSLKEGLPTVVRWVVEAAPLTRLKTVVPSPSLKS